MTSNVASSKRPQGIRESKAATPSSASNAAPAGKLGKVVSLLKRPKGATMADLMKVTGWQAHSVRGAIAGTIKKKLQLIVISEKSGAVRIYRIAN
jgi:hypothetical protein